MHLLDINAWLALVSHTHQHHSRILAWYAANFRRGAFFCRYTQRGLLRLLTNPSVMGPSCMGMDQAWKLYDQLMTNPRIWFAAEPPGVELAWRSFTQSSLPSTNVWNDSYLAAFAKVTNLEIVSFDTGFRQFSGLACTIL